MDAKSQLRICLEAEAILSVLGLAQADRIELVSSDALLFEIRRKSHRRRQEFALETMAGASEHIEFSESIETRAEELN